MAIATLKLMKSLVIVKHGNYVDVYNRLSSGEKEYYHAEKYWHDYLEKLIKTFDITIIAIDSEQHDVVLPNGVRSIGVNLGPTFFRRILGYFQIYKLFKQINPSHAVIRNPEPIVLWTALLNTESLLPVFADCFTSNRLTLKLYLLKMALKSKKITFLSNHNIPASLSMKSLGVSADRVVPWDWKYEVNNDNPDRCQGSGQLFNLLYVGRVTYGKGVAELIDAVAHINDPNIRLTIVGGGQDLDAFKEMSKTVARSDCISFLGKVRNSEVLNLMRSHDVVVIPSRHNEAEGLPVIFYEALQSNTPIICSNHAMFTFFFDHGVDVMFFQAGNGFDLADKIQELRSKPEVYKTLCANSPRNLNRIICPNKLDQIITNWLSGESSWFEDKVLSELCVNKEVIQK